MELLQKQASNRRLYFVERQYVSLSLTRHPFFYLLFSDERTKAIQYILFQREQLDQLHKENQSVNPFSHLFHRLTIFFIFS